MEKINWIPSKFCAHRQRRRKKCVMLQIDGLFVGLWARALDNLALLRIFDFRNCIINYLFESVMAFGCILLSLRLSIDTDSFDFSHKMHSEIDGDAIQSQISIRILNGIAKQICYRKHERKQISVRKRERRSFESDCQRTKERNAWQTELSVWNIYEFTRSFMLYFPVPRSRACEVQWQSTANNTDVRMSFKQ